ncbi:MAG TPA: hydrogenase iron-sulfur subunit [Syntrophorhabdaceae bacterium]|nr:hydrogenase iron-sulfur subunit [Syntrophorhabdaceae bacterium]
MNANNSEPIIVAFCCHYCAYAAADLAGSGRLQYPPNIRIVRMPCTGRLEVNFLMKAFEAGADGVLVAGCEEGSCHFKEGNYLAKGRVNTARQLLEEAGLEPQRLRMVNVSAASSQKFAEYIREIVETVTGLGPSPVKKMEKRTTNQEQTGVMP